jgi:N-acetyl-anhydromuramyl-L-alanine amidase AmpD
MTTEQICKIQKILGFYESGVLDEHTKAGIKNFQIRMGYIPNGELTEETFNAFAKRHDLDSIEIVSNDCDASTDLEETDIAYQISELMLSSDEYVTEYGKIKNRKQIFLHHTSGWNDPYATIKSWERDDRGKIGTHFVIGGINLKNDDSKFDGMIVKCIPDEYFGWHLGSTSKDGINFEMHKTSIGIEICNFGYLIEKNGKYFTYTGQQVPAKYVEDLGFKFRGYRFWHKYTDAQISALEHVLKMLSKKYSIDLSKGLANNLLTMSSNNAFEYSKDAVSGKITGILSHTNVRKDKTDVSPQKNLVEMLKKIA